MDQNRSMGQGLWMAGLEYLGIGFYYEHLPYILEYILDQTYKYSLWEDISFYNKSELRVPRNLYLKSFPGHLGS